VETQLTWTVILYRESFIQHAIAFSHCRNNDIVKLHRVECFCLRLITYCLGAMVHPHHQVKQLGVCWNDIVKKIFGYHRWESVKELQYY